MSVDPVKKILTYPDSHDPVVVELDNVMTGKTCWKAMNPAHQGEGLIEGDVLDYLVSTLLQDDFKLKKITNLRAPLNTCSLFLCTKSQI